MDDLIAFLRARLDDDYEIANRWLYEYGDQRSWRVVGGRRLTYGNGCSENVVAIDVDSKTLYNERIYVTRDLDDCTEHIARHDPARVLADVESKRQIIDLYVGTVEIRDEMADRIRAAGDQPASKDLDEWSRAQLEAAVLEGPVRLLALPFADHPDYREEWKP